MKRMMLIPHTSLLKRLYIACSANCFDSSNLSSAWINSSSGKKKNFLVDRQSY